MVANQIWYKQIGSDEELVKVAIVTARASGSIGASEVYDDGYGNVSKFATVRREGYQESDYVLV